MIYDEIEARNAAYREAIFRIAREAGWSGIYTKPLFSITMKEDDFLRFAALVAEREREALKEERRRDMAEIYSLRESEESLREEVERLRDELRQSSIDITRAEIERLREEIERLRADAERYRWLQANALSIDLAADPDNFALVWVWTAPVRVFRGNTLGDAINEAMKVEAALRREETK